MCSIEVNLGSGFTRIFSWFETVCCLFLQVIIEGFFEEKGTLVQPLLSYY